MCGQKVCSSSRSSALQGCCVIDDVTASLGGPMAAGRREALGQKEEMRADGKKETGGWKRFQHSHQSRTRTWKDPEPLCVPGFGNIGIPLSSVFVLETGSSQSEAANQSSALINQLVITFPVRPDRCLPRTSLTSTH